MPSNPASRRLLVPAKRSTPSESIHRPLAERDEVEVFLCQPQTIFAAKDRVVRIVVLAFLCFFLSTPRSRVLIRGELE